MEALDHVKYDKKRGNIIDMNQGKLKLQKLLKILSFVI